MIGFAWFVLGLWVGVILGFGIFGIAAILTISEGDPSEHPSR